MEIWDSWYTHRLLGWLYSPRERSEENCFKAQTIWTGSELVRCEMWVLCNMQCSALQRFSVTSSSTGKHLYSTNTYILLSACWYKSEYHFLLLCTCLLKNNSKPCWTLNNSPPQNQDPDRYTPSTLWCLRIFNHWLNQTHTHFISFECHCV